jgi:DNA-directed RNA polymerase specialized sigma24 family protein
MDDDETLIAAYYACDNGAMDTLYRRHNGTVIGFFRNGGLPLEEATDQAEEVWIRVMNTKSHALGGTAQPFNPGLNVPVGAWLFRIALRLRQDALGHLADLPQQMPAGTESAEAFESTLPDDEEPADQNLQVEQLREAVRACMNALPHNRRLALALELAREDLEPPPNQRQWAEQHGYTVAAYTAALHQARQQMRVCLERHLAGE